MTFNILAFITIYVCLSTETNIIKIKNMSWGPLFELAWNDLYLLNFEIHQKLVHCEMLDNMESEQITVKGATGILNFLNKKTTFGSSFNTEKINAFRQFFQTRYEAFYYSFCMRTLKMRRNHVNRKGNSKALSSTLCNMS